MEKDQVCRSGHLYKTLGLGTEAQENENQEDVNQARENYKRDVETLMTTVPPSQAGQSRSESGGPSETVGAGHRNPGRRAFPAARCFRSKQRLQSHCSGRERTGQACFPDLPGPQLLPAHRADLSMHRCASGAQSTARAPEAHAGTGTSPREAPAPTHNTGNRTHSSAPGQLSSTTGQMGRLW